MRHFFAFLISLAIHLALLAAGGYAASQGKKKEPSVAIEAVNFDLGMMVAANTANTNTPQKSEEMKAKTSVDSVKAEEVEPEPEPEVEPEPVVVPEPIVKPKPVVKPKPKKKEKKKVKKKPKPKKKKKVKKHKKKTKKTKPQPIKIKPSKVSSIASTGGGTQAVNKVKSNGSATASKGGKGSSNRGSADANAYKASLRAAISRIANRNYPRVAKRMRKQGVVTVRFNLARDGRISGATVVRSSGNSSLDKGAVKALKRLGKYKPPPPNVGSVLTVPIRFRLK